MITVPSATGGVGNKHSCTVGGSISLCNLLEDSVAIIKKGSKEFSGGPVVRTLSFNCLGLSLTPGQGTKIL